MVISITLVCCILRLDFKPDSSNKSECSSQGQPQNNFDSFTEQQLSKSQQQLGNREIQNLITSHIEANKIGRHIVDTTLDVKQSICDISSSPPQSIKDTIEKVVSIYRCLKIIIYNK